MCTWLLGEDGPTRRHGGGDEDVSRALFTRQVGALMGWLRFVLQASEKRGPWILKSECDTLGVQNRVTRTMWDLVSDCLGSNPSPISSKFYDLGQVRLTSLSLHFLLGNRTALLLSYERCYEGLVLCKALSIGLA